MLNRVILIGNVGRDAELKHTKNGLATLNFSIATSEKYKVNDQQQEKTTWHSCTIFRKAAETLAPYIKKGTRLYCEGKIDYNEYEDKNGVKRITANIVVNEVRFLSSKQEDNKESTYKNNSDFKSENIEFDTDDIPF